MTFKIAIQWTEPAVKQLRKLPPKVRKGLLGKADELRQCDDPREVHKPLVGPLAGFYRITYARYRAIYTVEEVKAQKGKTVLRLRVLFVAAGKREARSREDVYEVAKKLVQYGLVEPPSSDDDDKA